MSLSELSALVDELDIAPVRDELQLAMGVRDRLDARIARTVGEFDAAGLYDLDGDLTTQTWLAHHTGTTPAAATRITKRAARSAPCRCCPPRSSTAGSPAVR